MSDDNAKLDRAEALAVIIAQAVRAMRDLGADNQQIITALQIAAQLIGERRVEVRGGSVPQCQSGNYCINRPPQLAQCLPS
jgi:hypothetical protein